MMMMILMIQPKTPVWPLYGIPRFRACQKSDVSSEVKEQSQGPEWITYEYEYSSSNECEEQEKNKK